MASLQGQLTMENQESVNPPQAGAWMSADVRDALIDAVNLIRTWHGMHSAMGSESERVMWGLYYRSAPEMGSLRNLLGDDPSSQPIVFGPRS